MGSTQDAFLELESEITKITEPGLIGKNRTYNAILGEGTQLAVTTKEDREDFEAIPRFDISLIDSYPKRLDAFLYCYAQYEEVALDKTEAKEEFRELEPKAGKVKKRVISRLELLADESGNDTELAELRLIRLGKGREDLTMDFLKLSEKAKRQQEELATLAFGSDKVQEIEQIFERLKSLLGSINTPNAEVKARRFLMEQAYTYLAQAEGPIKKYGQIIFEDTERAELYKSESRSEIASQPRSSGDDEE